MLDVPRSTQTYAGEESSYHPCLTPQAVQVHGTVQQTHQSFSQSRFPARATTVQYGIFIIKILLFDAIIPRKLKG